ncbi:hypothetical protein ACFL5E_02150 [Candidatus Omnitrophota bacterium]
MKTRHIHILTILMALVLLTSGCAQLKEKFVRKSKDEGPVKRYQPVHMYDIKPNMDLYTKRYLYWKNWHKESLLVLSDDNHKKIRVSLEHEVSNLIDMHNMLVDEKAEELQPLITEMIEIEEKVKKEKITQGNRVRIEKRLETIGRKVKREFNYNKMRGYMRDDFRSKSTP